MIWEKAILASSVAAVIYTWMGYPTALWLLRLVLTKEACIAPDAAATFSIIIAAHNEAEQIASKLDDCLALEYPEERMEIMVVSDGSTDSTDQIVEAYARREPRVHLLRTPGRVGKSAAQNLAVRNAIGEILLFTDSASRMKPEAVQRIADSFQDPSIGLIAPIVHFGKHANAVSRGQGAYWRFELWLRQMESDLGILATASGAAFAIRRQLFREIAPHFGDDCVLPLDVCTQKFRVMQEAQAIVFDEMPHTIGDELRTRVRMTARSCAGTLSRPQLFNPLRFPGVAWGLVSHKILRWMTPFFLAAAFLGNALLAGRQIFQFAFFLQCCFYGAALLGWRVSSEGRSARLLGYPFAFCLANLGFLLGTVRCMRGARMVAYK